MSNFNTTEKFYGTININSNIKNNKKTIIGNFDLKDLLFILLGILVGLMSMTIMFFIIGINSIFICIIVIALVEIPIITIGFRKVNEIPYLDYIIMNDKSNNTKIRSLVKRKNNKKEKYILSYKFNIENEDLISSIDIKLKELRNIFNNNIVQVKIGSFGVYLTISITDEKNVNYEMFIHSYINDKELKGMGIDDINNYNKIIFDSIIYNGNKANNNTDKKNLNHNYIIVFKIKLYRDPFDYKFIEEILQFAEVTKYYYEDENNHFNTYILLRGNDFDIKEKIIRLNIISEKYKVLLSEICEENIKNTISLLMENVY